MEKKKQKRAITLIEIMIVILLIGLIGGVLAFNMRGSMDKGRVFKTEQTIARVYDVLIMESANKDLSLRDVINRKEEILRRSPLLKNGASYLKDAWGEALHFKIEENELKITSTKLDEWNKEHA